MGWKESEKLYFLKLVNEKKAVLFGKFMDTLMRDDKKNEWITIIVFFNFNCVFFLIFSIFLKFF